MLVAGPLQLGTVVPVPVGVGVSLETPPARNATPDPARASAQLIPRAASRVANSVLAGAGRPGWQANGRADVAARTAVVHVILEVHTRRGIHCRTSMSGRAVLHRAGAIRPTGRGGGAPHAPGRGEAARSSATDIVDTVVGGAFTGRAACEASALLRRAGSAGAGAVVSGGTISVGTASRRLASRCRGTRETTRALSGRARCACARAAARSRRRHLGISLRVHCA